MTARRHGASHAHCAAELKRLVKRYPDLRGDAERERALSELRKENAALWVEIDLYREAERKRIGLRAKGATA